MYYQEYLSNLCYRRQWPEPIFSSIPTRAGFVCVARVNNRTYQSDSAHESERLARENAAMRAYLICQNFSKSDGMYPLERKRGETIQGRPIAIGTERNSTYTDRNSTYTNRSSTYTDDSRSSGSRSGGSSPRSYDSSRSYADQRPVSGGSSSSGSGSGRGSRRQIGRYR